MKAHLILLLLVSLALLFEVKAQSLHENRVKPISYGPDQGMPATELHEVIQDDHGFLWISSDNGLLRFDGKRFLHFGTTKGLHSLAILHVAQDEKGKIYCTTLDNKIYFLEGDSLIAHPFNNIIESKIPENDIPNDIDILSNDKIAIGFRRSGSMILKSSTDALSYRSDSGDVVSVRITENQLNVGTWKNVYGKVGYTILIEDGSDFQQYFAPESELENKITQGLRWMDKIILSNGKTLLILDKKTGLETILFDHHINCLELFKDQLFIGFNENGYTAFENLETLRKKKGVNRLKSYSISDIIPLKEGGIILCTIHNGLIHLPNPGIQHRIAEQRIKDICSYTDQQLLMLDHESRIYTCDSLLRTEVYPAPELKGIYSLWFDQKYHQLYAAANGLYRLQNNKWKLYLDENNRVLNNVISFANGNDNRLWLGRRSGYALIDRSTGELLFKVPFEEFKQRVIAIHEDRKKRLWLGTSEGLFLKEDNRNDYQLLKSLGGIKLKGRVEAITAIKEDLLAFGVKGQGIIFLGDNGRARLYSMADGLISDLIETLTVGEHDILYVATTIGTQRLSIEQDKVRQSVHSNRDLGLLCSEAYDLVSLGDGLCILGNRGLSMIRDWPSFRGSPGLVIDSISSMGNLFPRNTLSKLERGVNKLSVGYTGIQLTEHGRMSFRYRFKNVDSTWIHTTNTALNLSELQPGEYQLQIQAGNDKKYWSNPRLIHFEVMAPWYRTLIFQIILVFILAFLLYLFINYRFKRIKEKNLNRQRIIQLERSALLAQMNPHFIFNALNSIQSYLAAHHNDKAVSYLAKFSKLIRTILNHSRESKVSLADEIQALEQYLKLEQMRFKDGFSYKIQLDSDIEEEHIFIPPLLTQPYLENAIIHGLSKKAGPGKIYISYKLENNKLIATIIDNGIGIEESKKDKFNKEDHLRKSVGMTITRERLERMDSKEKGKKVIARELKFPDGRIKGTQVDVIIKIESKKPKTNFHQDGELA